MSSTSSSSSPSSQQIQQLTIDISMLQKCRVDAASLDRVSHKLAMTDATKLSQILDKLLPRLLQRLGNNHQQKLQLQLEHQNQSPSSSQQQQSSQLIDALQGIHNQLIDVISHTMKRVRSDPQCQLPCQAILTDLLCVCTTADDGGDGSENNNNKSIISYQPNPNVDPFTMNLSLAFLSIGVSRLDSVAAYEQLLPPLLLWLGYNAYNSQNVLSLGNESSKRKQSNQLSQLLLRCIEGIVVKGSKSKLNTTTTAAINNNRIKKNEGGGGASDQSAATSMILLAKKILQDNAQVSAALYDLLLDVILYRPTVGGSAVNQASSSSSIPPDGLSQQAATRLVTGYSSTEQNWGCEFALPSRRSCIKSAVLDFVSPNGSYAIFLNNNNNNSNNNAVSQSMSMGLARTIALLVVGTGDPSGDVSEKSKTSLKVHMDAQHRLRRSGQRRNNNDYSVEDNSFDTAALGDPLTLASGLLSLSLGQVHAEAALSSSQIRQQQQQQQQQQSSLGVVLGEIPSQTTTNRRELQQLIMSTKRRAVSESTSACIIGFVASKILDDNPRIFLQPQLANDADNDADDCTSNGAVAVTTVATLALTASRKTLQNMAVSSGLSTIKAKPYIAAAELLNLLSVRLSVYYDNHTSDPTTSSSSSSSTTEDAGLGLLAQCFATACSIVGAVKSQRGITSDAANRGIDARSDGNLAVRDSCYGVICTLSRCPRFVVSKQGYVFRRGQAGTDDSDDHATTNSNSNRTSTQAAASSSSISIETAQLLFGCAANEEERLRPRAVAALDALLGAYRRAYNTRKDNIVIAQNRRQEEQATAKNNNPWLAATPATTTAASSPSTSSTATDAAVIAEGILLSRPLLPLIWTAGQSHQPKASRVAAAMWSSDLLKDLDLSSACHLLCFLAGDADNTASSIAREGLGLPSINNSSELTSASIDDSSSALPCFADIVKKVFPPATSSDQTSSFTSTHRLQRYYDFSYKGKAAALRFALKCLLSDMYGDEDQPVGMYLSAISETLQLFMDGSPSMAGKSRASIDMLDECSVCLLAVLSTSQYAREKVISGGLTGLGVVDLEHLALGAPSSRARRHFAEACGKLYEDSRDWGDNSQEGKSGFAGWVAESQICRPLRESWSKLSSSSHQVHGGAFLGAAVVRAFRLTALKYQDRDEAAEGDLWSIVSSIIGALGQGVLHSDEVIGNACCDSLAIALSYDGEDAPVLDNNLYSCCAVMLTGLSKALAKYGHGDFVDPLRAMKLATAAGVCLAATTTGSGVVNGSEDNVNLGTSRLACVEAVFDILGSLSYRKEDEIALIAGEALASYADAYSPPNAVWSCTVEVDEWPPEYEESFARKLPPHQHVLYVITEKLVKASSPHIRTSVAPALLAVVARAAKGVNRDPSYARRGLVQEISRRLLLIQQVFIQLLSYPKSKQLARESCCVGLAGCRGIVGFVGNKTQLQSDEACEELNQKLLKAFGQTTKHANSAYMETQAQAAARRAAEQGDNTSTENVDLMEAFGVETETGGASGISEASLGAYREMAAASVSLGRHDILYALLMLSVSHPCWFAEGTRDRYSASSLLGENSVFIEGSMNTLKLQEALRPHLGKLLPRILRARHDPNKQTREQMTALWNGLTGGEDAARAAITANLLPTIDALVDDATNKLWRARVGACGALSEIIVGRDWIALGGGGPVLSDDIELGSNTAGGVRLLRLWTVAMRSLDDVRGAVRESGESLARAVRALTIRLSDPSITEKLNGTKRGRDEGARRERNASAAAATALRWLIKHGLGQPCAEATGVCVSALVDVVDVVRPVMLQPILPDLLRSLLMAMSGLEPAALNYLQLRTTDQEGLERIRLQLVQSGPLATAVSKCLELLPKLDVETQQEVVPQLDAALRMSAGFATRAATADVVSTLISTCPNAFRFRGSSTSNPSVRLLRAFYFASERERGQAAKEKMIHALGNLCSVCPGSSVRSLAVRACERYNASTGSSDDPVSRKAAAAALRAIAIRATDQFADGGNSDIWRRKVLPAAYIGRKDSDAKVAALWSEVWDEGGNASRLGKEDGSFGARFEEIILPFLTKECIQALTDVAWTRRVSGANALTDLCDVGVLCPVPRATTDSRSNDVEKGTLLRARRRAEAARSFLEECVVILTKPRLWAGKSVVLKAAVNLASQWIGADTKPDRDERLLYGWDESSTDCPWKPISSRLKSEDDLFLGDKYFLDAAVDIDTAKDDGETGIKTPDDAMAVEADEDADHQKIDFEHCDSALDDENDGTIDKSPDAGSAHEAASGPLLVTGFCRFLVNEALRESHAYSEEDLPYKVAAMQGFQSLIRSLPCYAPSAVKIQIYRKVSSELIEVVTIKETPQNEQPPVLVAGALGCLGSCFWSGIGVENEPNTDVLTLLEILKDVGSNQPAWTVREASTNCVAGLASLCHYENLRKPNVADMMVGSASRALKDRKFWKVRFSGIKVLQCIICRAGTDERSSRLSEEKQLILEALLPYKEEISLLLRSCLTDTEAKVTALSSEGLASLSWWP